MARNLLPLLLGLLALLGGCSEGPENAHEYYLRAVDLSYRKQIDLAELELERALHLKPDYLDALMLQVEIDESQRDLAGLVKTLDAIIGLDPKSFFAHRRKAELLLLGEKLEEARAHIDAALSLKPESIEVLNLLIASLMQSGSADEAASQATALLDSDLGNVRSYAMGVASLIQLKRYTHAHAYLRQGVERYPNDPILMMLQSRLAQALGRLTEVPLIYEQVLELHPGEILTTERFTAQTPPMVIEQSVMIIEVMSSA